MRQSLARVRAKRSADNDPSSLCASFVFCTYCGMHLGTIGPTTGDDERSKPYLASGSEPRHVGVYTPIRAFFGEKLGTTPSLLDRCALHQCCFRPAFSAAASRSGDSTNMASNHCPTIARGRNCSVMRDSTRRRSLPVQPKVVLFMKPFGIHG